MERICTSFFTIFLLFPLFGSLFAQTISNIQLAYTCPCKVTATYDLEVICDNDVKLYYSSDTTAYGWMLAETFSNKTTGTYTDIWDCEAAGVVYGQFFFKMEVIATQCCQSSIGLAMVFVEGGDFILGAAVQPSTDGTGFDYDGHAETNAHSVTLSNFCISETSVTQSQFAAVMGVNPSYFKVTPGDKPVEQVSWYDAIAFCNKLSLMEGKTLVYSVKVSGVEINWATLSYISIPTSNNANWNAVAIDMSANGYRLPTEAEWEYAARGGQQSLSAQNGAILDYYYSGSNIADNVAWYVNNSGDQTHLVKQKQPNTLDLYDMSGNVYDWCWDWYAAYVNVNETDPLGPSFGSTRVLHGGSWNAGVHGCRVSYRGNFMPNNRNYNIGFRLARSSE